METQYGYNKVVEYDFDTAIKRVKEELQKEGSVFFPKLTCGQNSRKSSIKTLVNM